MTLDDSFLDDQIEFWGLGDGFKSSLHRASSAIKQRIRATPTTNVFHIRCALWLSVIQTNILPPEKNKSLQSLHYEDNPDWRC